jgi:hypothetical protein
MSIKRSGLYDVLRIYNNINIYFNTYSSLVICILVLAKVLALATAECRLDNKRTAIDGVDHSETAWEGVVRPGACIPKRLTATRNSIITREDIEVSDLLNAAAIRVTRNGADVEDTQTGLVVGLVRKTVVDELVVVDSASS